MNDTTKNLIIHPEDGSTNFLKPIYQKVASKTVMQKGSSPQEVGTKIEGSDRVLMMGHGSPQGLFNINFFPPMQGAYVIKSAHSDILRTQKENVYIWCNADKFVEFYDLQGFYSGMFISEVGEANFCGVRDATQTMVDESNETFSAIVGKYINLPKQELYDKVTEEYGKLAQTNPVASFNLSRLYVR